MIAAVQGTGPVFDCLTGTWTTAGQLVVIPDVMDPAPPVTPSIDGARVEQGPTDESSPLTSWTAIALAVGVSTDTLRRHRTERGDKHGPYFGTTDEARRWFVRLTSGEPRRVGPGKAGHTAPTTGRTLADLERTRQK